jgi:RNA polymerase sigma-70 factor (ECF subfamily)
MSETVNSTIILLGLRDERNHAAWQQFCARYEPMLIATARRAGLADADAHDVVQETILTFVRKFRAGAYDADRGRLRAWLQGIAFNKIREARRRLARREVQIVSAGDSTGMINRVPDVNELSQIFEEQWQKAVLEECLAQLRSQVDPRTIEAFRLYALEELPAEQVAERLGVSRNAVYISKTRVLTRLRKLQTDIEEQW